MNKKLYLFVENFSSESREEFFEKELPFLSAQFDQLIVIPLYEGNHHLNYTNPKITVMQFNAFEACNRLSVLSLNFFTVLRVFLYELLRTHNRRFYFRNFSANLNNLLLKLNAANRLKAALQADLKDAVFYSYWFSQWAFILSLLKSRAKNTVIVSRAHGSDYREEQTGSVLPFRYYQIWRMNAILPVSQYAKDYFIKKFRTPPHKLMVSRLGLTASELSPDDKSTLHLVSCSSLIPLKRVHLIAEILRHISIPVCWTHFGNGPELEKINKVVQELPAHCNVKLAGYVPNPVFLEYLQSNSCSFFINVSEHEGIPVTLMEAAARGIPLIGPNICGIPEIVTDQTGFLIPMHFDPAKIAGLIESQHRAGDIYTRNYRKKVQHFFLGNFSAPHNYEKLAGFLYNLNPVQTK